MTQTFYRIHWADSPEFNAANAWSVLWGATRSEDGTQTECTSCYEGDRDDCRICDGTGWEDALEGYSCCDTATELIEYFTTAARDSLIGDDDKVIVFEGTRTGVGFDGEPLAVPTRIIEETTWSEFRTRTN